MTIKLCLGTLTIIALHTLVWCAPAFAAERVPHTLTPHGTLIMPPLKVTPCVSRPLVQGSGSVRVCPGGAL